ncbi:hypothetical protein GCM10007160_18300 [Litchfieldella qijiaojingensis]|uniref:Holin of 3TMs, for gene-transfer release n=1 Tax=Litchfieldella qijiaojingensis TaxID=980347 RepID=A0ABQ2YSH2_9GAMM|nr:holin family protein [Halomonas qijiaojingensis]GGX91156.1 hypothetical protein GCM10007160_18300 [Halomonas qijiaojingensis]
MGVISSAVAGGLFDIGGKLIDRLFPDPEQKAKAKRELEKLEQEGELKKLSTRMSTIMAEAESDDPWTSRARPSFMYVFYLVIISLVIVAPTLGIFYPDQMETFFNNVGEGFKAIPEELWWTFTSGYLGYGAYRTYEKRKGVTRNKP